MADTNPKPWSETTIVGKAIPRIDGRERLSGVARYSLDMDLPDMLYAATLRCPHAHARVVKVDLAKAARCRASARSLSDADKEAHIPLVPQAGLRRTPGAAAGCSIRIAGTRARKSPWWRPKPRRRRGTPCGPSRCNTRSCPLSPIWTMR